MRFVYHYMTVLLLLVSYPFTATGQIGIGTITPNPSAIMDMTSQNQGMLTPRMTTAQREAIANPANGLLVFDTDMQSFEYFSTSENSWLKMSSKVRDNFVLVKSQADFPAAVSNTITLDENSYYEINGSITLSASIDLNGAYISGLDASEDLLYYPGGTIFKGNNGGSIRNLTLSGAKAFEITGPGINSNTSLLLQNTIVINMTAGVGSISGIGFYFSNTVQFINNKNGITYTNIGNLLLNNQAWLGDNSGTFEKLTGSFGLVEKVSGFSTVNGSAVGFDVSSNPSVSDGVMLSTAFSGSGIYVKRYLAGSYPGFNFTKNWTVNCPGIPVESDNNAGANFYYNGSLTNGFAQTISNNNAVKITGSSGSLNSTTANSLFRFTAPTNNKLIYEGTKKRDFQVNASLSVRGSATDEFFAFLIAKNGIVVTESNAIVKIENTTNIQNISINAIISMTPNDYIEIFTQRLVGTYNTTLSVFSENLSLN